MGLPKPLSPRLPEKMVNFGEHQQVSPSSPSLRPPLPHHQAFTTLQTHFSNFLHLHHHHQLFDIPLFNPLKTPIESGLSNLRNHVVPFITTPSNLITSSFISNLGKNPTWARIADRVNDRVSGSLSMPTNAIEERLAGVPVYALSNSSQEFVLVSGVNTGKSLGLFCFNEKDAETLLEQMKSMDPGMRQESQVVAVALNKVFQLKVDGVAFRLIPELSQIKNALTERQKAGYSDENFSGVPVFQSKSLILRSQNKRYRPVFFRKEDLEKSLARASHQQRQLNPGFREGDIQVAVLEDIIQGMKGSTTSKWDDVVFVPPGFDVSTEPSKQ